MMFSGKTAFVTGGSSGIGLGIAQACSVEGMKVGISYLTDEHLEEASRQLDLAQDKFFAVRLDVTDRDALDRAAQEVESKLGPVNLLVNNAGVGFPGPILGSSPEKWEYALSVNVMGVVNSLQAFVPGMVAHGGPAHVVTTASMSGLFAAGGAGVYTTTKYAVVGMMEALKNELLDQGIGVSICCPGIVQSKIADWQRNSPFVSEGLAADHSIASTGMHPLDYGRYVLEGVRQNALYILTHAEYREGLAQRCEALRLGYSEVLSSAPPQRLAAAQRVVASPIYEEEIQRLRRATSEAGEKDAQ